MEVDLGSVVFFSIDLEGVLGYIAARFAFYLNRGVTRSEAQMT